MKKDFHKLIKNTSKWLNRQANKSLLIHLWRMTRDNKRRIYELEHEVRDLKTSLMTGARSESN